MSKATNLQHPLRLHDDAVDTHRSELAVWSDSQPFLQPLLDLLLPDKKDCRKDLGQGLQVSQPSQLGAQAGRCQYFVRDGLV